MSSRLGDESSAGSRLVAAAVDGVVYVSAIGMTEIHRLGAAQQTVEPWVSVTAPIAALAATGGMVIVVSCEGHVSVLATTDADIMFELVAVAGAVDAVANQDGVWVLSADRRTLVHVSHRGLVDRRLTVSGADRVAVSDAGVWYTTSGDQFLRFAGLESGIERRLSLGMVPAEHSGLAVCGNAVWLSAEDALVWAPEGSDEMRHLPSPSIGPVRHLLCVTTGLVGGDTFEGLFALSFIADDSLRSLSTGRTGRVHALVTDGRAAWAVARIDGVPGAIQLGHRPRSGG